jgi:hypothetical protein
MKNKSFSKPPVRRLANKILACVLVAAGQWGWATHANAGVPDWLRAVARAPLPAFPPETKAVMLLDEHTTTVKDSGDIETQYRHAYKILRPEGREYGLVGVYFDSETRLTYLKA